MKDNTKLISEIYQIMSENKILLTYHGEFTDEITNALLQMVKRDTRQNNTEIAIRKKIYKIMVECLENICRHADVAEKGSKKAIFLLAKKDEHYFITTGNFIYEKEADGLMKKLDSINAMDKNQLREKYREVIKSVNVTEKGDIGLGLIDIAIKSENKLDYDFKPVEDNISFYMLEVKIASV